MPKIEVSGFSGMGQDVWETIFGRASEPSTTRVHSGSKSVLLLSGDALYQQLNAHVEAFSGSATKKWWTGFHSPDSFANPAVDDEVFICQLTDNATLISPPDRKHLVLVGLMSAPGGVNKFQYRLSILGIVSGTLTFTTLVTDSTAIDPSGVGNSDMYMFTVQYDASTAEGGGGGADGTVELFIGLNGTATSVGSHALSSGEKSGLQLDSFMCPDTRTGSGKGATQLKAYFDDLIPNDDDDAPATDGGGLNVRPTFDIGIVRATVCADTSEDDWTGNPDTSDKYKNWNDDSATDFNDPTSTTNHRQVSDVEEIDTGTVYGIRVVFSTGPTIGHDVRSGLSGSFRTYSSVGNGDNSGAATWWGRTLGTTPEATPQGWTTALYNTLGAGVEALSTDRDVDRLWVNVIGDDLVLAGCPVTIPNRIYVVGQVVSPVALAMPIMRTIPLAVAPPAGFPFSQVVMT
jgi:hypothetical protein